MSEVVSEPGAEPRWPRWQRVGFRALLIYLLLLLLPFPLSVVPKLGDALAEVWDMGHKSVVLWIYGLGLGLGQDLYLGPTGSGDTTYAYLLHALFLVLALAGAGIWSLLERTTLAHPRAARWLELYTRFYLAATLCSYGLEKLVPMQMPEPGLDRLLTPIGDISPMGLVWLFMGASPVYESLAGAAELLGGLLLFHRRTRLLGATLSTIIMTNVVMLNYLYDVPVKLYSSQLLLMAIAIVALDGRRLVNVFVLNREAPPAELDSLFTTARAKRVSAALGALLAVTIVGTQVWKVVSYYPVYGPGRPHHALYGIHEVERFVYAGEERPPLLTDELRWRALVVNKALPMEFEGELYPGSVSIQAMSGELIRYRVEFDDAAAKMMLSPQDPKHPGGTGGTLIWTRPQPDELVLRGIWNEAEVEIHMRARDLDAFELTTRGFHWINEFPYHR